MLLLVFNVQGYSQDIDSEFSRIKDFILTLQDFSKNIPQEKVYLHFDNTSYYQEDNIWFKCYIVTSGEHQLSWFSKTLYVELLNPGGEIVDKRILKIENGQCHGDFTLNHNPFYSGFYEVRAYTKYMLNFGDDVIFSRLLPVFDKPKIEGNYEEKDMLRYTRSGPAGNYPMKREQLPKEKKVNLRFFPEGGNLIQGVASRIAFEATDEVGKLINVTGVVMDATKQELCQIVATHEGRGVFTYTPVPYADKRRKDIAEVEYSGKKYQFDLPPGLPKGVVMEEDNLTYSDSIVISLQKNENTLDEMFGVVVVSGGKLQKYYCGYIEDNEKTIFKIDKTQLPSGVSQIVLFNGNGEIVCDRLIFTRKDNTLNIKAKTGKSVYKPNELVNMELSVIDKEANPVNTNFSLSVRDGANHVNGNHNILTDLLLMSEIKGYVSNPSYYFENEDDTHREALDVLLMVQGWRRYSWKQMAGVDSLDLKYFPEQSIETHGQVVTFAKNKPKQNVDVSLLLKKSDEDRVFFKSVVTDQQGCFSFESNVYGKWSMILSVTEKGRKKDYRILVDRVFSPEPKRYRFEDLQISIAKKDTVIMNDEETPDDDFEDDTKSFTAVYADSLEKLGIDKRIHYIPEVTIKEKKRNKGKDIYHNRSTSIAYYDMASEVDDIYDRGIDISDNIHEVIVNMNKDFTIGRRTIIDEMYVDRGQTFEYLSFKGKPVLFVVDYQRRSVSTLEDVFAYRLIPLNAIKSIYINTTTSAKCEYSDPRIPCFHAASMFGCVVFIETLDGRIPVEGGKGVRKTWLDGYSNVRDFYSPNYSELPPGPDYRRTLYWNPLVFPDEKGKAKIQFYNNSSCTNFNISAETVTPEGMIGVYKDE